MSRDCTATHFHTSHTLLSSRLSYLFRTFFCQCVQLFKGYPLPNKPYIVTKGAIVLEYMVFIQMSGKITATHFHTSHTSLSSGLFFCLLPPEDPPSKAVMNSATLLPEKRIMRSFIHASAWPNSLACACASVCICVYLCVFVCICVCVCVRVRACVHVSVKRIMRSFIHTSAWPNSLACACAGVCVCLCVCCMCVCARACPHSFTQKLINHQSNLQLFFCSI